MRAVVLDAPGAPENLVVREIPKPEPAHGWVRIRVRAFGLNRSDLSIRRGLAGDAVSCPRVLGAEAVGTVDLDRTGRFAAGQRVVAVLGGMGLRYDGGYAEYTCVPTSSVIPFECTLNWAVLAAVPVMFETARRALGDGVRPGQSVLVRGGTSAVGLAAVLLAKNLGTTVLATTRDPGKVDLLRLHGADHVLIDDGSVEPHVRGVLPDGVTRAIELVGATTAADTLRATRVNGVVRLVGALGGEGTISPDARLVRFSEDRSINPQVLRNVIDDVAAGRLDVPVGRVYRLAEIAQAHRDMEAGSICGKAVVVVDENETIEVQ